MTSPVEREVRRVDVLTPYRGLVFVHPRFRIGDRTRPLPEWGRDVREVTLVRRDRVYHRMVGTTITSAHMTVLAFLTDVTQAFQPCPLLAPPEAWEVLCRAIGNNGRELPEGTLQRRPLGHPWLVSQRMVERVDGAWQVTPRGRMVALMVVREPAGG